MGRWLLFHWTAGFTGTSNGNVAPVHNVCVFPIASVVAEQYDTVHAAPILGTGKSCRQIKDPPAISTTAGGLRNPCSTGFVLVHDEEPAATLAPNFQKGRLVLGIIGEPDSIGGPLYLLAIDLQDHVARLESRLIGG